MLASERAGDRRAMGLSPDTMQAPANDPIAVVESFFRALEAKDLDAALALMSDDVVYQNVPLPADRGKPAVERTLKSFQKIFDGFEVRMRNIAARDGVVLTERVDVLSGPFLYIDIWVCGTFEVKDGKITLWRDYFDLAECAAKVLLSPFRKMLGGARRRAT
jgi:limonene-1,2-epoxide hydrolase